MPRLYVTTQTAAKLAKLLSEQGGRGAAVALSARRDVAKVGGADPWILIRLTAWAQQGSNVNKFRYAFEQVAIIDTAGVITVAAVPPPDGVTGTTSAGYAINPSEISNPSSRTTMSDGVSQGGDYPQYYYLQPLGGRRYAGQGETLPTSGTCVTPVVCWARPYTTSTDPLTVIYLIGSMLNAHDGTCSA